MLGPGLLTLGSALQHEAFSIDDLGDVRLLIYLIT